MSNFQAFLSQPYSFYYEGKKLIQLCIVLFLIILFYNSIIEPFNIYKPELRFSVFTTALVHTTIPILFMIMVGVFFQWKPSLADNWTLQKELLLFLIILVLVGLADFFVRDILYNNPNNWSIKYLIEEVFHTLMGGLLLIPAVISVNLNIQMFKNLRRAEALNENLNSSDDNSTGTVLSIDTQVQSETFELNVHDFIAAISDGNYLKIYLCGGEVLLKRLSLSSLEDLMRDFPYVIRTHRSFMVNKSYIKQIKGNAQGYQLRTHHLDFEIPVSRNYIKVFNEKVSSN